MSTKDMVLVENYHSIGNKVYGIVSYRTLCMNLCFVSL